MNDYLKEALALVRAQASVRVMSEDEIMAMVKKLTVELGQIAEGPAVEAWKPHMRIPASRSRKSPLPAWSAARLLRY